jgi:hypothetical protein
MSDQIQAPISNAAKEILAQAKAPVQPSQQASAAAQTAAPAASDKAAVTDVQQAQKEQDPEFASKFAALTRKQKEIYFKEQELKKREEKVSKYESWEKLKTDNPFQFALEHGLDIDGLIKGAVKHGEPTSVEDKLEQLQKKVEAYEKAEQEKVLKSQQDQEKQSIDNFKKSIKDKLSSDLDKYELINLHGDFETVYDLMNERFLAAHTEYGGEIPPEILKDILDVEKAAEEVENYFLNNAKKLLGARKLGAQPAKTNPESQDAVADKNKKPEIGELVPDDERGLTLSGALTPASGSPAPTRESPEEAKRRIAAEFNAKLKAR